MNRFVIKHAKNSNLFLVQGLLLLGILTSCLPVAATQSMGESNTKTSSSQFSHSGNMTLYSNYGLENKQDFTSKGLINPANKQAFFDFDKGEITSSDRADVYLSVSCGTDCFSNLLTINNAKTVFQFDGIQQGREGCLNELKGEKTDFGLNVRPGQYSCLQTNQGNIVEILVSENQPSNSDAKLDFTYTLWKGDNP
jgi:hypothetical protein